MNKSEKIILAIVAVVIVVAIIYFAFFSGKPQFVYYTTTSGVRGENELISDFKTFDKKMTAAGVEKVLVNGIDFSKSNLSDTFNEEYFATKKVALVSTYEDTGNNYAYSVDKVEYNSDKTSATIYYTDKKGENLGTVKNIWYNYMLVEVDGTVTNVDFVKEAD